MNLEQKQAAQKAMTAWLAAEQELGKEPVQIVCTGDFLLHDMRYYMFKYKENLFGKWLLGVCGGYQEDSLDHCGHIFSEMAEYHAETAQVESVAMVEMIREYWMQQAKEEMEHRHHHKDEEETRPFLSFVLLAEPFWQPEQLQADLKRDWQIEAQTVPTAEGNSLVWEQDGMLVAVSLMPGPVPNEEAVQAAANNQNWPDAVAVSQNHQAHLLVAVMPREEEPTVAGQLFVKVCDACLQQKNALAIYTLGTVMEPKFYHQAAAMMQKGDLPILNWVYFGLYENEQGMNGYTYGLYQFDQDEIEIIGSQHNPQEICNLLFDLSYYVLDGNITLQGGETIDLSTEQKLAITRSEGVAVEGESLKIEF